MHHLTPGLSTKEETVFFERKEIASMLPATIFSDPGSPLEEETRAKLYHFITHTHTYE